MVAGKHAAPLSLHSLIGAAGPAVAPESPGLHTPPGLSAPPGLDASPSVASALEFAEAQFAGSQLIEAQRRMAEESALLSQFMFQHECAKLAQKQQMFQLRAMAMGVPASPYAMPNVWPGTMPPSPTASLMTMPTSPAASPMHMPLSPAASPMHMPLSPSFSPMAAPTKLAKAAVQSDGSTVASDSDSPSVRGRRAGSFSTERSEEPGEKSTVMMRNIPNNYTRDLLLQLVDKHGFAGSYDLAYLPVDFASNAAFGYAFLNFTSAATAQRFRNHFQGFRAWDVPSGKVCEVLWGSTHQGLEANIERYRNCPVMHESVPDSFKPAIFVAGSRVSFPAPTRKLHAPKITLRRS